MGRSAAAAATMVGRVWVHVSAERLPAWAYRFARMPRPTGDERAFAPLDYRNGRGAGSMGGGQG